MSSLAHFLWLPLLGLYQVTQLVTMLILCIFSISDKMTKCVFLPGSGQCTNMELGPLESGYLELLNSNADPLQLYHLYDQMGLAGEEEIELCSGALSSLRYLPCSSPLSACSGDWQQPVESPPRSSDQHRGQLLSLAGGWLSHWERLLA